MSEQTENMFRGKTNTEHKIWVWGNLKIFENGDTAISISGNHGMELIERAAYISGFGTYSVFPSSVGRYTGMKDENGRKIFEGDLLNVYIGISTYNGRVEYDNITENFIIKIDEIKDINFEDITTRLAGLIGVEVVGNVFDNKLKEDKNDRQKT